MGNGGAEGRGALRPPSEVRVMFDRISPRYDLMNRLMTAGRDLAWRRAAARAAVGSGAARVLDVATGTGDLALELVEQGAGRVTGVDFAAAMLRGAVEKLAARGVERVDLVQADAMRLPFPDGCFDACTIAFGLRNLPDYPAAVMELARVVRPGGRVVILEMTPVRQPLFRPLFGAYFDHLVPLVGGLVSGEPEAYRYLPRSVQAFPSASHLTLLMWRAGLREVRYRRFALGTVALHVGVKG